MIDNEIKLRLFSGNKDRLKKSNGSIEVKEINGSLCHDYTFIPREPWDELNKIDYQNIVSLRNHTYKDISLIKIPYNLVKLFESMKLKKCININDINYLQNSPQWQNIILNTLKYLSKFNLDDEEIIPHKLYFGQPNLKNNTFNSNENVFIGMHLDSWEGDHIYNRHLSRNRICINLGNESRYLLFYNISIISMARSINYPINEKHVDVNSIYKKFALKNPDFPIYRLEILPYEAYIASTEFIIHDGSSWNSKFPDINLTFRGRFYFKKHNTILNFFFLRG